jgi:hypothetical protein
VSVVPRSRGSQFWVLMTVAIAVGLVLVGVGYWRKGLAVIGATFGAGAVARLVIPEEHSGMLHVRGRTFDVVWTAFLGVSLTVLAVVVPPGPEG